MEHCMQFAFYNKPKSASKQASKVTSVQVFVLHDGLHQLCASVLLLKQRQWPLVVNILLTPKAHSYYNY